MSWIEVVKNFVYTTLGHAFSGGAVAGLYEVTKLIQGGVSDVKVLGFGLVLGACVGFFKTIVEELEKAKPITTAAGQPKTIGKYFGV